MFDFLFEGGQTLYLILLIAGLFFLVQWYQRRDKRSLYGLAVVAGLALLAYLLDLRVTDQERALKTLQLVTESINEKHLDEAFSHFADDFRAYGMNKEAVKTAALAALRRHDIRSVRAKSIEVREHDREKRTITLRFNAAADVQAPYKAATVEVDFAIDSQDRCRVKSFRVYKPGFDNIDPWDVFSGQ